MLKTLLKSSAVVAVIALGAGPATVMAQSAPETTPAAPGTMAPEPVAPEAGGTMAPEGGMAADPTAEPTGAMTDLASLSAEELIGADIKTGPDNETVATVEDVLLNSDGTVKNIVAKFGGFLGFGENTVLLMPDEVMAHKLDDGTTELTTTLTPEALKDRPEYEAPSN